jgi:hypothetical protein
MSGMGRAKFVALLSGAPSGRWRHGQPGGRRTCISQNFDDRASIATPSIKFFPPLTARPAEANTAFARAIE